MDCLWNLSCNLKLVKIVIIWKSAKNHALVRNSGQKIELKLIKIRDLRNIWSAWYSNNEGANYDVRNRLSLYIGILGGYAFSHQSSAPIRMTEFSLKDESYIYIELDALTLSAIPDPPKKVLVSKLSNPIKWWR